MKKKTCLGVGLVGCGNIAPAYFKGIGRFPVLKLVSCADINMMAARDMAAANNCRAQTVKGLLANKDIDLVINLTIPAAHAEVSLAAIKAGKHVYSEKPLGIELDEGKAIIDAAKEQGVSAGCAPDTFLGGGLQTCRKIIDDGWIGRVVGGTVFLMSRGPESWHPNPFFFYKKGAGPMFDMGPYYMTALVHLLGPAKRVAAITSRAFKQRIVTCKENWGKTADVDVPTHYSGALEFHSGAVITTTISFDVCRHGHSPIELYGTEGSLKAPDPNTFDGPVELFTRAAGSWQPQALSHPYTDNYRGIGTADMACAIIGNRPHRASGAMAYHVLEIMQAFAQSSETGRHVAIKSRPKQPEALPLGLIEGRLEV